MILVQKLPVYYGNEFVDVKYQIILTVFVQMICIGLAGILRQFTVYPVKAVWPFIFTNLAMNRALLLKNPEKEE